MSKYFQSPVEAVRGVQRKPDHITKQLRNSSSQSLPKSNPLPQFSFPFFALLVKSSICLGVVGGKIIYHTGTDDLKIPSNSFKITPGNIKKAVDCDGSFGVK
jgi:hypothetical protein